MVQKPSVSCSRASEYLPLPTPRKEREEKKPFTVNECPRREPRAEAVHACVPGTMEEEEEGTGYVPLKAKQLVENNQDSGMRISHIRFGTFTREEIERVSEFEVTTNRIYEMAQKPIKNSVLDRRLGAIGKVDTCETCHEKLERCPGHYGHIKLALPVFHVGYFKPLVAVLQCICKTCSRVLLPADKRLRISKQLQSPLVVGDYVRRVAIMKKVVELCKKEKECSHCKAVNGVVKRVGGMRLIHEKFKEKDKSERAAITRREFNSTFELVTAQRKGTFEDSKLDGPEVAERLAKAQEDLNPLIVRTLLRAIPECDIPLLDMESAHGRPENLIIDYLAVPPSAIRPSVITLTSHPHLSPLASHRSPITDH